MTPTLLARSDATPGERTRLVSAATSARLREIMRLNVTNAPGTGRHAEAEGYRVGGKTGTAEMPGRGGYREKSVISSFAGAFPWTRPDTSCWCCCSSRKPARAAATRSLAALNAAPTTARIVERIAPLLGVLPRPCNDRRVGRPRLTPRLAAQ